MLEVEGAGRFRSRFLKPSGMVVLPSTAMRDFEASRFRNAETLKHPFIVLHHGTYELAISRNFFDSASSAQWTGADNALICGLKIQEAERSTICRLHHVIPTFGRATTSLGLFEIPFLSLFPDLVLIGYLEIAVRQ